MRMIRNMFKSQATVEAEQAAAVDAGIKDGTIGRVVNDRADHVRVVKYRQEQAKLCREREEQVRILNERREMAKNFQATQELATAQTQANFAPGAKMSAVQERLSLWKPKRLRTEDAAQLLEETKQLRQ